MLNKPWLESLLKALRQIRPSDGPPRVAVIGIGSDLNGDDAAGIALARALEQHVQNQPHMLVVDAGSAPENTSGLMRRFGPDLILFVDAAEMGEQPGTACWIDWRQAEGISASTHTLPLDLFASYLESELGCPVGLIGIQPARNAVGEALSPEVQKAVSGIALDLARVFHTQHNHPG